ncbi:uncharacterized protein LOC135812601 [Sycon ciliatum]|uniref:uncharacterized protein LOC135812601 n=1 Tax=Sycon ciliatum TaxID=27933 RepID=UPI0031F6CD2B
MIQAGVVCLLGVLLLSAAAGLGAARPDQCKSGQVKCPDKSNCVVLVDGFTGRCYCPGNVNVTAANNCDEIPVVKGSPFFEALPVTAGETLRLSCSFDTTLRYPVQWINVASNNTIKGGGTSQRTVAANGLVRSEISFIPKKSMLVACKCRNSRGSAKAFRGIVVKPKPLHGPAVATSSYLVTHVPHGKSANLSCAFTGLQTSGDVQWLRNGSDANVLADSTMTSTRHVSGNITYAYMSFLPENDTWVTCVARNSFGVARGHRAVIVGNDLLGSGGARNGAGGNNDGGGNTGGASSATVGGLAAAVALVVVAAVLAFVFQKMGDNGRRIYANKVTQQAKELRQTVKRSVSHTLPKKMTPPRTFDIEPGVLATSMVPSGSIIPEIQDGQGDDQYCMYGTTEGSTDHSNPGHEHIYLRRLSASVDLVAGTSTEGDASDYQYIGAGALRLNDSTTDIHAAISADVAEIGHGYDTAHEGHGDQHIYDYTLATTVAAATGNDELNYSLAAAGDAGKDGSVGYERADSATRSANHYSLTAGPSSYDPDRPADDVLNSPRGSICSVLPLDGPYDEQPEGCDGPALLFVTSASAACADSAVDGAHSDGLDGAYNEGLGEAYNDGLEGAYNKGLGAAYDDGLHEAYNDGFDEIQNDGRIEISRRDTAGDVAPVDDVSNYGDGDLSIGGGIAHVDSIADCEDMVLHVRKQRGSIVSSPTIDDALESLFGELQQEDMRQEEDMYAVPKR